MLRIQAPAATRQTLAVIIIYAFLISVLFALAGPIISGLSTTTYFQCLKAHDRHPQDYSVDWRPRIFFPDDEAVGQAHNVTTRRSLLEDSNIDAGPGFLTLEEQGAPARYFGVSMLHQAHCLAELRAFVLAPKGSWEHSEESHSGHEHHLLEEKAENLPGSEHTDGDHLVHCLDYLAQVRDPLSRDD